MTFLWACCGHHVISSLPGPPRALTISNRIGAVLAHQLQAKPERWTQVCACVSLCMWNRVRKQVISRAHVPAVCKDIVREQLNQNPQVHIKSPIGQETWTCRLNSNPRNKGIILLWAIKLVCATHVGRCLCVWVSSVLVSASQEAQYSLFVRELVHQVWHAQVAFKGLHAKRNKGEERVASLLPSCKWENLIGMKSIQTD